MATLNKVTALAKELLIHNADKYSYEAIFRMAEEFYKYEQEYRLTQTEYTQWER